MSYIKKLFILFFCKSVLILPPFCNIVPHFHLEKLEPKNLTYKMFV